jgi:hypothetical protein
MIVDVFMFNDEFFHLECRMYELKGVVDRFVAVEGNRTMQGAQKPYHLEGKEAKYRKDGLDVVRADLTWLDDVPEQKGPWVKSGQQDTWKRDWKQRNAFKTDDYPEDTIFIFSDVDEIPKRATVEGFSGNARVLMQQHLIYSVKYTTTDPWAGPVMGTRAEVKTFARARNERWKFPALPDGGWHLGWFGGELAIQKKAREFAHGEMAPYAKEVAEKYPREHIRPAGGLLEPYGGTLPTWVEDGHAPNSWYLEW